MRHTVILSLCLTLFSGCITARRPVPHAPAEEASQIQFPAKLPTEGLLHLDGNTAAASLLAMDDFLPWGTTPPPGVPPETACRYRRESYDVSTAPGPVGIIFVRLALNDAACPPSPSATVDAATGLPPLEVTTYAVDVRTMRVLTFAVDIERRSSSKSQPEPKG
jgi:hypothetical protein